MSFLFGAVDFIFIEHAVELGFGLMNRDCRASMDTDTFPSASIVSMSVKFLLTLLVCHHIRKFAYVSKTDVNRYRCKCEYYILNQSDLSNQHKSRNLD